jgi:tetratricopeptide (TPR) repeat protein
MSVAAVAVTLLGALIAYAQSHAIRASSAAGVRAERLSIQEVHVRSIEEQAAQLQYSRFQLLQSEQRRMGNAWQALQFGDPRAKRGVERWQAVSDATDRETEHLASQQSISLKQASFLDTDVALARRICPITAANRSPPRGCNFANSPTGDAAFPRAHFADAGWHAERLVALRDEASARASQRAREVGAYAITLSVFAVAIFLFGFALNREAVQRRGVFVVTALVLVGLSVTYSSFVYLRYHRVSGSADTSQDRAASYYADGVTALSKGNRHLAAVSLGRAIHEQPDFARAYYQRGLADANLPSRIKDLQSAAGLGLELATAASQLAESLTQLAIQTNNPRALRQADRAAKKALSLDRADPVAHLDRGLILLVRGQLASALDSYRRGVSAVVDSGGRGVATARILAAGLSDLQALSAVAPRARARIERAKELLVEGEVGGRRGPRSGSLLSVAAALNPGGATWDLPANVAVDLERVGVEWYRHDPRTGRWATVPEMSGHLSKPDVSRARHLHGSVSYLASTTRHSDPRCLSPGTYKVEIYGSGRLIARGTARIGGPQQTPWFDREMNIAMCLPPSWRQTRKLSPLRYSALAFPATIAAWESADRSEGALLLRLNGEFSVHGAGGKETRRRAARVAAKALAVWARAFPGRPHASRFWSISRPQLGFSARRGIRRTFSYRLPGAPHGPDHGVVDAVAAYNRNDVAFVSAIFGPDDTAAGRRSIAAALTSALP